jgi:hypothetical protein
MRYVTAELCHSDAFRHFHVAAQHIVHLGSSRNTSDRGKRITETQLKAKRDDSDGRGGWRHRNHSVTRNVNTIRWRMRWRRWSAMSRARVSRARRIATSVHRGSHDSRLPGNGKRERRTWG